jgi:hypothetical protein
MNSHIIYKFSLNVLSSFWTTNRRLGEIQSTNSIANTNPNVLGTIETDKQTNKNVSRNLKHCCQEMNGVVLYAVAQLQRHVVPVEAQNERAEQRACENPHHDDDRVVDAEQRVLFRAARLEQEPSDAEKRIAKLLNLEPTTAE